MATSGSRNTEFFITYPVLCCEDPQLSGGFLLWQIFQQGVGRDLGPAEGGARVYIEAAE
jgi:hypothetical protein